MVDDNKSILSAVEILLRGHFEKVILLSTPNRIKTTLREESVDVVLLDMNFSAGINTGNEGLYWLSEIKKSHPAMVVVLFTAYADIELAVRGMKEGATDFLVKPWSNHKLIETLGRAYLLSQSDRKVLSPAEPLPAATLPADAMFWGESVAMKQLRLLVEKVAVTDANVLITGENGTGKEMLAREIHRLSRRSKRSLVAVDMGAIVESLFESELFGHVKGAFTDARTDRPGKFESAHESTLFLDEIGNMPYHLQAKLLVALQGRQVVRVGSNESIAVNLRLICATNRNLPEMVQREQFREDLLYRINTIHVEIPPLRERREDVIPLCDIFLARYAAAYGKPVANLTPAAKEKLTHYAWPGNIRELQHTLEKAVIIADRNPLDVDDFHFCAKQPVVVPEASSLEEMESNLIRLTIEKFNGNLSQVAVQLGITRQTLYNKIKRYEL